MGADFTIAATQSRRECLRGLFGLTLTCLGLVAGCGASMPPATPAPPKPRPAGQLPTSTLLPLPPTRATATRALPPGAIAPANADRVGHLRTLRLQTLSGHTDRVTSVAFSSDGQLLLSGSWDDTVRLWAVR